MCNYFYIFGLFVKGSVTVKKLNQKEKLFCTLFAQTGNGREAAAGAGYTMPQWAALRLMAREEIRKEVSDRQASLITRDEVCAGLRRIAFGSVADALKLLRDDVNPSDDELEKMDMFCISEIKKNRSGGIEIKFYDRLKALECLREVSEAGSHDDGMLPFYEALERGAEALNGVMTDRN